MGKLDGKIALVTGANSGIGLAKRQGPAVYRAEGVAAEVFDRKS